MSWKDYYSAWSLVPTLALFPELLVRYHGNVAGTEDFFADAAAGKLPQFCLVEPNYLLKSEEAPQNIAWGEQFAARVINAVMSGAGWEHTLLLWLFEYVSHRVFDHTSICALAERKWNLPAMT